MWNNFVSSFFRADIGIGQESVLSPILFTLCIAPIFHIFKKRWKNLFQNSSISFLSFIDNNLFILQDKSFKKLNTFLFYSYNIISSLFDWFGLIVEYEKSEIFHFFRSIKNFKPPSLDLTLLRDSILQLKDTWKYLGFIFNKKLFFQQHICFYSNKALSTIKNMKILGNSTSSLLLFHKQLLYKICVLSITLYGLPL